VVVVVGRKGWWWRLWGLQKATYLGDVAFCRLGTSSRLTYREVVVEPVCLSHHGPLASGDGLFTAIPQRAVHAVPGAGADLRPRGPGPAAGRHLRAAQLLGLLHPVRAAAHLPQPDLLDFLVLGRADGALRGAAAQVMPGRSEGRFHLQRTDRAPGEFLLLMASRANNRGGTLDCSGVSEGAFVIPMKDVWVWGVRHGSGGQD